MISFSFPIDKIRVKFAIFFIVFPFNLLIILFAPKTNPYVTERPMFSPDSVQYWIKSIVSLQILYISQQTISGFRIKRKCQKEMTSIFFLKPENLFYAFDRKIYLFSYCRPSRILFFEKYRELLFAISKTRIVLAK